MPVIAGMSNYIAFIDECGDHSLQPLDRDFPVFVLATVIVERNRYRDEIIPAVNELKLRYWDHEGVILHSRDIRKARGSFSFLQNPGFRSGFLERISSLIRELPFKLFICGINKYLHRVRYGAEASDPYDLALKFSLERIYGFLKRHNFPMMPFIAESRGKREDEDLERVFFRFMSQGTYYLKTHEVKRLNCQLIFKGKSSNIVGTQLADLAAYPCARYILNPNQENRAYEVIQSKIYDEEGLKGWKVFP